ncbi:ABC transporter ATP-binding protein [Schaalia suimastitidis]|uniref:ABC transporter ATP-binding protein n=1 Tax=Schaalia suimastitidis TaxID=121163 RepID=UPI0003FEBB21|nr:ABC transporter ATP-binding protein [Schaalia suimastitidis]
MTAMAVRVDSVSKRFRVYRQRNQTLKSAFLHGGRGKHEDFWALRDITFEIPEGRTFGLLGHNGSGKSTLLKCIAKILKPDTGRVVANGRLAAMLEVGSGFHPELSGRENIYLNAAILGMTKREVDRKFIDIVDFSGVGEFIDQPVKNYSSGMYVRLGFSVSVHIEPDILLVDEILAVGDMAFQRRCMAKFADFREEGRTVVVVSHALDQMRSFCDEVAWLDHGCLQDVGNAIEVIDKYAITAVDGIRTSQGGIKIGSGEVEILAVDVLNAQKQHTSRLNVYDSLTLRVHYRAHEVVRNPVFGVSIDTSGGTVVWGLHGLDADFLPKTLAVGDGYVDVHIPKLSLRPNEYVVSAAVQPHHLSTVLGGLQKAASFEVMPGPNMESGGLVALNARFLGPTPEKCED